MQLIKVRRLRTVLGTLALSCGGAVANDIYIAQNAAGAANGADCADAHPVGFFNTASNWGNAASQLGPGTTVHVCGTITASPGATVLRFQASGASGSPITLLFEAGAIVQAPYFAASKNGSGCGGGIGMCGLSFVTVDGGSNGVLQNTANGDAQPYQQLSAGIDAIQCNNCIVRNLTIANIYVHVSAAVIDGTQVRALAFSGSNWTVAGNTVHDCGWCLFDNYANGDTNVQILQNNIYNMGHGLMFATSSARGAASLIVDGNRFHDTAVWDSAGCAYHNDGIHTFGTTGSSINGVYLSNNYFYGNWGVCPTGFIFIEGTLEGTPSHASDLVVWNNVAVVPSGAVVNTNGWFGIFSGDSGTNRIFNNTVVGPNNTDNSLCLNVVSVNNLYLENNAISQCGDPVAISGSTFTPANVDHNFYGTSCGNLNNCFIFNNSFTGSFASWQRACSCDAHSVQNNTPLLDSLGSPEPGSLAIGEGANLASFANGSLASLARDTTLGGTRSPLPRSVSSTWDSGAYEHSVGPNSPPNPPVSLITAVQ